MDKSALGEHTIAGLKKLAGKHGVTLKSSLKADIVKEMAKALKPKKTVAKKTVAKKATTKKTAAKKTAAKKVVKKTVAKKTAAKKTAAKKVVKKTVAKKTVAKKTVAKKTTAKKTTAKKAVTRKAVKKAAAKKALPKKKPAPESMKPLWVSDDNFTDNWVSCIPVEPEKIFVSWELAVKSVRPSNRMVLRVGSAIRSNGDNPFIQVPINKSSGGMFIDVAPGSCYAATMGIMSLDGNFMPIANSQSITTPPGIAPEGESLMPDEHFGFAKAISDPASSI